MGGNSIQNSSGVRETLNGSDYDLGIRNGDTDRAINLRVGTIGSKPEIQFAEGKINVLGNLEITHTDVSARQRVFKKCRHGWMCQIK